MARKKKRLVKRRVHHRKKHEWGEGYRCRKCGDKFATRMDLDLHIEEVHHRKSALAEIQLLERGFLPEESKLGMPFKGKNKIIVA
ncbi:MAG: hypothetical protein HZB67_01310 [Candidatus Aenigmarchaeota archaeon]|nr:hypothetical protein [Candidatus Aenigmarchaeota archaeon]